MSAIIELKPNLLNMHNTNTAVTRSQLLRENNYKSIRFKKCLNHKFYDLAIYIILYYIYYILCSNFRKYTFKNAKTIIPCKNISINKINCNIIYIATDKRYYKYVKIIPVKSYDKYWLCLTIITLIWCLIISLATSQLFKISKLLTS